MPKKQNLAMLEAPPEPKSTAHVGPPYKTLPPIGSAPPTGRQRDTATPRKLSTAPGLADTTLRGDRPSFSRSNTTPLEFPESAAYQSGHTTRQTMKTEGDASASESLETADGRHQPRAEKHLNSEDGFFMTQVRNFAFELQIICCFSNPSDNLTFSLPGLRKKVVSSYCIVIS